MPSISHKTFIDIAELIANESYCERKKVGAIIVKDNSIIALGLNGGLAGGENICENDQGETLPTVSHAEANAILRCAKTGASTLGADLYVTLSPCNECAKMIIQSGITSVYYSEVYREELGLEILLNHNVNVTQIA